MGGRLGKIGRSKHPPYEPSVRLRFFGADTGLLRRVFHMPCPYERFLRLKLLLRMGCFLAANFLLDLFTGLARFFLVFVFFMSLRVLP